MPTKSDIDEITAAAAEFGATIVSVFTEEEVRNLRTAVRWGELYNSDATQMVKECYATDCRVEVKGAFTYHGHDTFIGLEQAIHSAAPRRRGSAERLIAVGNTVVCQGILTDPGRGANWSSPFCVVLTLQDGKIILDQTYMDITQWPSPLMTPSVMKEFGLDLEFQRPSLAMAVFAVPAVLTRKISHTFHRLYRR